MVTYIFPTEFSGILTLYSDRVNLNSCGASAVVAGASFLGYGDEVLNGPDVVVEILVGMAMLRESVALLPVLLAADRASVVLSPACEIPRRTVRIAKNQKLLGRWGHHNSILPPVHTAVRRVSSAVGFSSCWWTAHDKLPRK
jgi:hypothetical protein